MSIYECLNLLKHFKIKFQNFESTFTMSFFDVVLTIGIELKQTARLLSKQDSQMMFMPNQGTLIEREGSVRLTSLY